MNKVGFLLSSLLALLGFITLNIISFTTNILPKIGLMVFKLAGGSYSPNDYIIAFTSTNTLALFEIIIGLGLCVFFYTRISKAD